MDKGLVQVGRKDDKVVVVHQEGKVNNAPRPLIIHYTPKWCPRDMTQSVTNIPGIGGITRSGRNYALESLRRENPAKISTNFGNKENSKGKESETRKVPNEESTEFLKFIYELIDQLK
ncbi:hypothetical protein CR513_26642, partial [Mucuna pruriens]